MNKRLLLPVLSLLTGLLLTTLLVSVTRSWPTSFETAFAASEAAYGRMTPSLPNFMPCRSNLRTSDWVLVRLAAAFCAANNSSTCF